ncbi:alpha-L-fucosidase [Paenibacillus sp. IB182496]|uniref:alpha-L-fucosidase n=1 Tax=Paenibacillus sabuli TaxID=2772509 RepID=A0A927GUG1_9BACL|nr:alpha-L-fucosidase [Paenibacillus sabuli]MBD2847667.1 alpha-L-fucosidase [Paenibacillus sabuli]
MTTTPDVPSYLKGYESLYARNPREAALAWFRNARSGLFIHYGLYSLLGRGEWVMYHERIPVREYERLQRQFTAEGFDADRIVDLAVRAGMSYIAFTTRHHDSFCLFESAATDYHSGHSPAGRDLVQELAEACARRGVGLFLYYSYGADWHHPYFVSNASGVLCARPEYERDEPAYLLRDEREFERYIAFMHDQLRELLTGYGPVAGVWFDLISACYYRPDLFPVAETYALVRELQPQCLISFKQGVTGDEDYMSQEMSFVPLEERLRRGGADEQAIALSNRVWRRHETKWNEVCTILQRKGWGYVKDEPHIGADEAWERLAYAGAHRCNLLLNTGLLPDGAVHPQDCQTLLALGERVRKRGWPGATSDSTPPAADDTGAGAV